MKSFTDVLSANIAARMSFANAVKICDVCNQLRSLDSFEPHRFTCKKCRTMARYLKRLSSRPSKPIAADGMKICTSCGVEKPTSDFGKHKMGADGVRSHCRSCKKLSSAKYYRENTEKCRNATNRWSIANADHLREARKQYAKENPHIVAKCAVNARLNGRRKAYEKAYREKNKDRIRSILRNRYDQNRDEILTYSRAWYWENKARHNANSAHWAKSNREKVRASVAKRRASKLRATPKWATASDIQAVYSAADRLSKLIGIEYEVDHVVPLTSDIVCGLHCHANLQVLAKRENRSKGNREWPDMP